MGRILLLLIILFIAVWAGVKIHDDPGYLLLTYSKWTVEAPLWLGAVIVLVAFFVIYFFIRFFHFIFKISDNIRDWKIRRRLRRSLQQTNHGLIELTEGHWAKAERNLIKAAKESKTPLINYLSAARAAQEQAAYDRRDNYLRLAHKSTSGAEVAVGLTQAELQLRHGQLEQGLATLKHLQSIVPHHKHVIKLLQNLYVKLKDWNSVIELLPKCRKYNVLSTSELTSLEKKAYSELLYQTKKQNNTDDLKKSWSKIPSHLTKDAELVKIYCWTLIENGEDDLAEQVLKDVLRKNWDDTLVELYGLAKAEDASKQLSTAEYWLKSHKNNAILLLTLGKLAKRNQLWGKARTYLENCINLSSSPASYYELGQVFEHLGEHHQALECYRKGLS